MAKKPESNSIIDMFARLGREMKLPDVDIERAIEHHRRNLEALEKSARAAGEGASKLATRQREMLEEALEDVRRMAQNAKMPSDARGLVDQQAEFMRQGFETAVRNTGEMADLFARSGTEALDILRERLKEGMAEVRQSFEKRSR
jgi:phasin family protein